MNRKSNIIILLVTICVVFSSGCLNETIEDSSKNSKDEQLNLPFTIHLEKDEYLVGEPINVTATIKNIYNETINIGEVKLDTGTLDFEIITPNNISLSYTGPIVSFVGKIQLRKNETTQATYNLLEQKFGDEIINKYNFTMEGNYSIQGRYHSFATTESVIDVYLHSNKEYFIIKET